MKTFKLIQLVLSIFLFTGSTTYSQTDSVLTYYPDDISIEYSNQSMKTINMETGRTTMVPILISVMDIKKIKFFNDTLISISSDHQSEVQMNISKIHGIGIKSGTNLGLGIGIGALIGLATGLIAGLAIGSTYDSESSGSGPSFNFDGLGTAIGALSGSGIGIIVGGIVGGIIGSNSPTYKTYDMNKHKFDKKKELERILKIDKKTNSKID